MCGRSWWRRPQANAGVLLGGVRSDPPVEDWLATRVLEVERIISRWSARKQGLLQAAFPPGGGKKLRMLFISTKTHPHTKYHCLSVYLTLTLALAPHNPNFPLSGSISLASVRVQVHVDLGEAASVSLLTAAQQAGAPNARLGALATRAAGSRGGAVCTAPTRWKCHARCGWRHAASVGSHMLAPAQSEASAALLLGPGKHATALLLCVGELCRLGQPCVDLVVAAGGVLDRAGVFIDRTAQPEAQMASLNL